MSDYAASAADREEHALQTLLRVIASRDRRTTSRLLAESPPLARMAISVGATLGDESAYYLEEIMRYTYAGDTPLHIAAAAYQRDIAEELVSRGARVSARNRRGAEPLHYVADGTPGSPSWNPDAQHAVVEFLIGAGADPNSEDKSGVTPLHRAVRTRCTPPCAPCSRTGLMPSARTRVAQRRFIWRFRTPDVEARDPQLRVKNKRRSYDCFSATVRALPTKIPPADPSRIASRPSGFRPYSGSLDYSWNVAPPNPSLQPTLTARFAAGERG